VYAGVDFLMGRAIYLDPFEMETVKQEGWIWVQKPVKDFN